MAATDVYRTFDRGFFGVSHNTTPNYHIGRTSEPSTKARGPGILQQDRWSCAQSWELMSERAPQERVPASSAQFASTTVNNATYPEIQQRASSTILRGPSETAQRSGHAVSPGPDLPPLSRSTAAGNTSPNATRIAGVSSILNPEPRDEEAQTGQRRKASQLKSPEYFAQPLPPISSTLRDQRPGFGNPLNTAHPPQGPLPRSPRRILTPISPSVHRAASLSHLNAPSGTLSAQQTPFPPSPRSKVYTVEPGKSGAPPLPGAPAALRPPGYGFPPPPQPSEAARRASTGTTRARKLSSSASPATSYSSYSQAEMTSPSNTYAYPRSLQGPGDAYHDDSEQRQMGIPISSSAGPNVYQMMTLETTSGTVQLPVDVQAASRVADEKRRRNAGASARFRQRRKEKEKESSTTIGRLEQRVKEVAEDADYYRGERDYFRSVLRTIPGAEQHLQRPPSPRHLRGSHGSISGPMSRGGGSYVRPRRQEAQSPGEGRNVRRRTSNFSLPAPSAPPLPPPPGPPLQPSFQSAGYAVPLAPAGPLRSPLPVPPQAPPSQQQQPSQPIGPPPVMQTRPQTGPYNPYERRHPEAGRRDGN